MKPCVLVLLTLALATARADDKVRGFVSTGTGPVEGRVTDATGHPVRGARVHVVSSAGNEAVVMTDDKGHYRIDLPRADIRALVFVYGDLQIGASTATTELTGNEELVVMHEMIPPAVYPEPVTNPLIIPEYSENARDANEWTRAWLLLEISDAGTVTRIKFLNRPGYDLDAIAIREAFKLRFEPARNRANRAIAAQTLWAFEWPSFWWMHDNHEDDLRHIPHSAMTIPCRGTGPTRSVYRDCSAPNIANVVRERWITKP
jgi:hypothetical protein